MMIRCCHNKETYYNIPWELSQVVLKESLQTGGKSFVT